MFAPFDFYFLFWTSSWLFQVFSISPFDDLKVFCSNFKISFVNIFVFKLKLNIILLPNYVAIFFDLFEHSHILWYEPLQIKKSIEIHVSFSIFCVSTKIHFGKIYIYIFLVVKFCTFVLLGYFKNFTLAFWIYFIIANVCPSFVIDVYFFKQCVPITCYCCFLKSQWENIR